MIRPGVIEDMDQLMRLAATLHAESEITRHLPIDRGKLSRLFAAACAPGDPPACVFVYTAAGTIRGALLGVDVEYFFSRERYAADMFLYVDETCRRGLLSGVIAKRLWERFRDWARARGLHEIRNGVSTGIAIDASHRLFVSLGMTHIGGLYRLALR